jgi:hypothetical protein
MYYALNRSQSNASAFKRIRIVQALKHPKQLIHVLHIKSHPIVPNEYYQAVFVPVGAPDLDFSVRACAREFNRVGNKVHQHKP